MNGIFELANADIFFLITSVVVIIGGCFIFVALFFIVRILYHIMSVTSRAKNISKAVMNDAEMVHDFVRKISGIAFLTSHLNTTAKKRSGKMKK